MATILLSAVGAAVGGAVGGSVLGLSTAVIGRAVGATIGQVIDQRILGTGSETVETGRIDRFRLSGASEGAPISRVYGRVRVSGQVIWTTEFLEDVTKTGGGKGAPPSPTVEEYSYSVSLAIAIAEGEILGVGRVWADGEEISRDSLNLRVYTGSEDQLPDPKIEAVEGEDMAPAYRGTAYVIFEDLQLAPFGNRVPQFSFEVVRSEPLGKGQVPELSEAVKGVALMPGTGEYALATTSVTLELGPGEYRVANVTTPSGGTDFETSLDSMNTELPNCNSVSLIVSWFGDDLRCSACDLRPKVEQNQQDGKEMPWEVCGLDRSAAQVIATEDDRPIYGGTPSDESVIEAIRALNEAGKSVTYYPFILMEQLAGNGKTDPWTGAPDQPVLPWRGRITLSLAPGQEGSPDGTAGASAQVAAFFGDAQPTDFSENKGKIVYSGPAEWSYRRFILHQAHICALAGDVDAFCIGSEMRGLTQIRGDAGFPAVNALRLLATDVRSILGPDVKIGYAADWSEYFGYHPQDGSGDVYFHLDPLWADANIDFIGIDNYMPLSDWRDGWDHADADWGSIYNLDYLKANIEGGEGYEWYYAHPEHDLAQLRTPISDGSSGMLVGDVLESAPIGESADFADSVLGETAFFHAQVRLPINPVDAMLWEHGGRGRGVWLGVRDGGTVMRLRAGDSGQSLTASSTTAAVLDIPVADLPFDGQIHELAWELKPIAPGRVRLWIDGELVGSAETIDGSDLEDGLWSGPNSSSWLVHEGSTIQVGETNVSWPVSADASPIYRSVLVEEAPTDAPWVYRFKDIRNWWANRHYDRRGGRPLLTPSPWAPQSKPIWFTEIGCAAVDKGTNQPNKFLDPKSSESSLPKFSNGRRDDFIQMQYLRAIYDYWSGPNTNPVSEVYGGPMIDMEKAHVWAWDARPYPFFPGLTEVWSDGANYSHGHWLNGRSTSMSLAGLVSEISETAGLTDYDVSQLYGVVRGLALGDNESGRAVLQPLMLAYGFDAVEQGGRLVFQSRDGRAGTQVDPEELAMEPDQPDLTLTREAAAEVSGRLRLTFTEADADFAVRAEEGIFPDETSQAIAQTELPLVLTRAEARGIVERWLSEARVARDTVKFAVPPSKSEVKAGGVLALETDDGPVSFRVDRVEEAGRRLIEAVRVEPQIYEPSDAVEVAVRPRPFAAPVPVFPVFMDLPLLTGDEVPHAPHIAVSAKPWPGTVAVYSSLTGDGYSLNKTLSAASAIGVTETPMMHAEPGVLDRSEPLRVKFTLGDASSVSFGELLNGANAAVIGDVSGGNWEVFQFQFATLVASQTYELSGRLRGQAGSDGVAPLVWPEGSIVVLLNGAPKQIELAVSARGISKNYRIGPAQRSLADPSYVEEAHAFDGNGLRPYSPSHLKAAPTSGGDIDVTWIRRTRIDGDSWRIGEVPLGESREEYLVQVLKDGALVRTETVGQQAWRYLAAEKAADGVFGEVEITVAQISDRYGPGPSKRITIDV